MHYALAIKTVTTVLQTAERHGASIPKALTTEHAKLIDLMGKARALADTPADFTAAVVAALEAGNDPSTDPAVRDALTRRAIHESQHAIEAAVGDRVTSFITANGAALLACFVKPFDAAAERIRRAADLLGDVDLDNTAAVLNIGPDAASAWAEARNAEKVMTDIQQVRNLLTGAAPALKVNPQYRVLAIADVPAQRFWDDQLRSAHVTPWEAARRGYRLSLALPDELRARISAALAEMERRNTRADSAFGEGYRRARGVSVA